MKDFRDEWFFKEWYSPEELETLWNWVIEGGDIVEVKEQDGRWSGFHPLDTEMKIGLASQRTKEDCINWMKRLGFNIK